MAELLQVLIYRLDFRFGDFVQHIGPKDEHRVAQISFDFGKNELHFGACDRVAFKRHGGGWRELIKLMIEVPIQVEAERWRAIAIDVIRDQSVAVEVHDFQRLVEVFHLHGVRAEAAHLHELFFVADQGGKYKILGQFLVEFLALLRVVAVDFSDAEEHGHQSVASCESQQKPKQQNQSASFHGSSIFIFSILQNIPWCAFQFSADGI